MSKHIAFLGAAAALLGAALPAAAADYYDGGGDRPFAFHGRDDVTTEGDRARVEHRQAPDPRDLGPGYRRAPGPVVFDERGPDRRFDRPAYGYGAPAGRYGDDRPVAFGPPGGRPYGAEAAYGDGYRPAPLYRPAAVPVGPGFGDGYGGPDVGCTIEQVQSTTPLGWRKIVTHRTCYRR